MARQGGQVTHGILATSNGEASANHGKLDTEPGGCTGTETVSLCSCLYSCLCSWLVPRVLTVLYVRGRLKARHNNENQRTNTNRLTGSREQTQRTSPATIGAGLDRRSKNRICMERSDETRDSRCTVERTCIWKLEWKKSNTAHPNRACTSLGTPRSLTKVQYVCTSYSAVPTEQVRYCTHERSSPQHGHSNVASCNVPRCDKECLIQPSRSPVSSPPSRIPRMTSPSPTTPPSRIPLQISDETTPTAHHTTRCTYGKSGIKRGNLHN